MNSLRRDIIEQYINENFGNPKIIRYDDFNNSDLKYYNLEDLKDLDSNWFPLCAFKDEKTNKLVYGGSEKIVHTYIEGETGCGKTTRILIQSIKALSSMKSKHSILVVDPFGEIYENTYKHFNDLGYVIKVLNCDNSTRSDTYNPLYVMALDTYNNKKISIDTMNALKKIALIMCPKDKSHDPIWSMGASSYLYGVILNLFEELSEHKITPDKVNLYNIIQRHYWIRAALGKNSTRNIREIDYYEDYDQNAISLQKIIGVVNNAERTRDSYFGVLEHNIDKYSQDGMYTLSSNSTIDLNEFIEQPSVIFVQPGASSVGDELVSLIINDIYTTAVLKGKKSRNKKLPRNIHCFIDEFANCEFGSGEEFIKMLTTSRKFGIYWHLFLQCDAQLDNKYQSTQVGDIIRANATEIFMGSQDYKTITRFSESCGIKVIESLNTKLEQKHVDFTEVKLIDESKLSKIPEGEVYIKLNKKDILQSYYEAFYKCDEFKDNYDSIDFMYPHNEFNFKETLILPDSLCKKKEPKKTPFIFDWDDDEEDILARKILRNLLKVKTNSGNELVAVNITQEMIDELFVGSCKMYLSDEIFSEDYVALEKNNNEEIVTSVDVIGFDEKVSDVIVKIGKEKYESYVNSFTFIPDSLMYRHTNPNDYDLPSDYQLLKKQILAKFIKSNRCRRKLEWVEKFMKEVDRLEVLDIFPKSIIDMYKKVFEELHLHMTIDDIKKIKNSI